METRHQATAEDVNAIADLARRGEDEDASQLVSRVILSDSQREVIRAAHARRPRLYEVPEKFVYTPEGTGYFRCWQGGAPGLVQQRIRRF